MNSRWFAQPLFQGAFARGAFVLAAAALLAGGCKNKGAAGICPPIEDCGGNPVGVWQVEPELTCSFPVVTRMAQNYDTTRGYFEPETGATPPAVTSGTWCWDLSFDKDGNLATPKTPVPNPDIVLGGTVTFNADQTYLYTLTAASTTTKIHIARSCLGVNGSNLGPNGTPTTCDVLAKKMSDSISGSSTTYGNVSGTQAFRCTDAGDGCDCDFDYTEQDATGTAVGDRGTWVVDSGSNVIHHYSISGQGNFFATSPSRRSVRDATFCVKDGNDTLELSGANGTALALKAGARTLTLKRVIIADAGADAAGGTGGSIGAGGAGGEAGGAGGAGGAAGEDGGSDAQPADAADDAGDTSDAGAD